MKAFSLP